MKGRYLRLFIAVLATGAALALLSRLPRREAPPAPAPAPAARAEIALALDAAGAIAPARSVVPKGADVTLTVTNHGSKVRTLSLAGYETHLHLAVPPGATAIDSFRADHPGSDFAWLVDGEPAGKFAVSGSHLVEGHE
ncbi:MAG TPA: hypothetical protein VFS09_03800 [Candidatus Eisenbacteria bacterium]|nr:hypothetical protein [Candidatus Eisenbacteria bacterium]